MIFIFAIIGMIVGVIALMVKDPRYLRMAKLIGGCVVAISLLLIIFSFLKIVPAGRVGLVDLFGKVSPIERKSGINIVNPLASLRIMDIQTQEVKEVMPVPSKEGLIVTIDLSILYKIKPEVAAEIYVNIGSDYKDIIVVPQFRSACRGATVGYEAKALYTSSREEISRKIFDDLNTMLIERGIVLEKVLLRNVSLPAMVANAIETKLKREQESEEMKFVIDKERQLAEQRIIEAEGIARSQEIINKTLTNAYLQHEAIQAQRHMADSPNHTTVYIPSGDNGIPIIKNIDKK